jgi:glycosyltransferase involved in cell wall biosynthesis
MSRAGRERAIAEYRVELITERYVELYRSVTAG